jgi:hypothetical protein
MKVALLLHGQARNLMVGYISLYEHILNKYDVDVYCQVWWDEDVKKNGYLGARGTYPVDKNTINEIYERYNPKKILVEKPYKVYHGNNFFQSEIFKEYPEYKNLPFSSKEHILSQFLSLKNVSSLLVWGDYDFIIKSRYDINLCSFPNLYNLNKKKFYPAQHNLGTLIENKFVFCDYSFIMANDMEKFLQISDVISNTNLYDLGYYPEAILASWLNKLKFDDRLIKLNSNEFGYL